MGYKKGPAGHMKAPTGNKAVGYMAEGSAAYMEAMSPLNHEEGPEGHEHDPNNPGRYTYQSTDVGAGTKRTGSSRRKLARELADAANQGLDVQGYTTSGSSGYVQLKNKKLKARTGSTGDAFGSQVEGQTSLNTGVNIRPREIKKFLKKSPTVNITGGNMSPGTSQTVTATGNVRSDERNAAIEQRKAAQQQRKEQLKVEIQQKRVSRAQELAQRKAAQQQKIEQRRAELDAQRTRRR